MSRKIKLSLVATTLLALPSAFAASGTMVNSGSCWSKAESHHHCTGYVGEEAKNWVGMHSGRDVYSITSHDNAYLSYGVFGQLSRNLAWWNEGDSAEHWNDKSYVFGSFYNLEVPVLFRPTESTFAHVRLHAGNQTGMPVTNNSGDPATALGNGYTHYRGGVNSGNAVAVDHFSVGSELFDNFTVVSCALCSTNDLVTTPSFVPDAQLAGFAAPLNGVVSDVNNGGYYGIGGHYAMDDLGFAGTLLLSKGADRADRLSLNRADSYTVPLQVTYSTDSMFATLVYSPNHVGAGLTNDLAFNSVDGNTSGALTSVIGTGPGWEGNKWLHPIAGMFEYSSDDFFVGASGTWTTGKDAAAANQRTFGFQVHGAYHGLNVMDHPLELFVAGGVPLHVYSGTAETAKTPYFLGGAANWKVAKDLSMAVDLTWLHAKQNVGLNEFTNNFVVARLAVNWAYAGYVNEAPFFSKGAVMKQGPVGKGHR